MAIPAAMFGYDDRFLPSMLEERQRQQEEHGLMALARTTGEWLREVREWQVLHPGEVGIASAVTARPEGGR